MKKLAFLVFILISFNVFADSKYQTKNFFGWELTSSKDPLTDEVRFGLFTGSSKGSQLKFFGFACHKKLIKSAVFTDSFIFNQKRLTMSTYRVDKETPVQVPVLAAKNNISMTVDKTEILINDIMNKGSIFVRVENADSNLDGKFDLKGFKEAYEYFKNECEQL